MSASVEPVRTGIPASASVAAPVAAPVHQVPITGYVLAALGAILFSAKAVLVKLAYTGGIDSETLLALRMAFALPFYLAIGWPTLQRARRSAGATLPGGVLHGPLLVKAAGVGILGYWFSSYVDFLGLQYISASFERLILFTYPLFVVLFGALFFGQRIQRQVLVAFGLSYVGLALIFVENFAIAGSNAALGAGLIAVAAIAFATYQLTAKTVITVMGARLFTCVAMIAASAVVILQFLLMRPLSALLITPSMLGLCLALAIGCTVLPSFLMNMALQRISAQANSTISTMSPVATMVLAYFILSETPGVLEAVGAVIVMISISWFTLADRKPAG